jgi:hypothetical protein
MLNRLCALAYPILTAIVIVVVETAPRVTY